MGPQGLAYWRRVFYSECLEKNKHLKKKTPKKKTKEKSTKKSEDPKMDEDEINRLMQNAFDR